MNTDTRLMQIIPRPGLCDSLFGCHIEITRARVLVMAQITNVGKELYTQHVN